MSAVLEMQGLGAGYGRVDVLHGVDLVVAEGEKVTLLGPNGAGKTTVLRAVSRLVRTTGALRVAGRDVTRLDTAGVARLGVAHVPQGRGTFTDLSVAENLRLGAFGGARRRAGARVVAREVDEVLDVFGALRPHLHRRAGQLSGGQQQMLALARALLARPRLLLVDEPSLGLAPLVVRDLFEILERLQERCGTALLLAEQSTRLSLALADRACVLAAGRVVLLGPASDMTIEHLAEAYLGGRAAATTAEVTS